MECLELKKIRLPDGSTQAVPCGKCGMCLSNKRSSWMFRIHHEMRQQLRPGWFLTLTYDPKHVKRVKTVSRGMQYSLRFRDVQLFLKRVRKAKYYCKYVCVGEYGPTTVRPHYHMLLWTDCPPLKLESFWGQGHIRFGSLTMASAMYTLKYCIQPKPPEIAGVERPRAQFSKGLGLGYLTRGVYEYHTADYDNPEFFSYIDGRKVSLPRYYRQKIFTKHQCRVYANKTKWDAIRKRRKYMRELIAQGVVGTKEYISKLKIAQSGAIIKRTKYSQIL